MSAPLTADAGAPAHTSSASWRAYGVALLPLALAGYLPLWACLLMGVVFALGVRQPSWAEARLLGSILVVGVVTALHMRNLIVLPRAQLLAAWRELGPGYLGLLLTTASVYWVSTRLEYGQRRGLLLLALVGAMHPTAGLLLALAGGALARYAPDDRLSRPQQLQNPRMWVTVGLVAVGITVLALALPRERFRTVSTPPSVAGQPALSPDAVPPPTRQGPDAREELPPEQTFAESTLGWLPRFPNELFLLAQLPAVLLLVLGALRFSRQGRRRIRPIEWMLLVALFFNFGLLLLLFVPTTRSALMNMLPGSPPPATGLDSGSGGAAQSTLRLEAYLNAMMWLAFFFYLALGALLFYFWRNERDEAARPPSQDEVPQVEAGGKPAALHRVRLAFREAEGLLLGSGRGRLVSETPLAYASRLSAQDGVLSAALHTLTRAYEPVRYGGRVTDEDADAAEQAVRDLRVTVPTLPRPEEPETAGPGTGAVWKEKT